MNLRNIFRLNATRPLAAMLLICFLFNIPTQAETFVVGPSKKVLRNEAASPSETYDAATGTIKLVGAKNEFVSFQIVFTGAMRNVNIGTLTLTGPGGKIDGVQFFREHYIASPIVSRYGANNVLWDCADFDAEAQKINAPREFPVQMVPLSSKTMGAPFDVTAGKNEVVWADVFIPEKMAAGNYTGTFTAGTKSLKVSLKVWNFALPSVSHFPQWAGLSPEWIATAYGRPQHDLGQMGKIRDDCYQICHDHRLVLAEDWEESEAHVKSEGYIDYETGAAFKGPFGAGFGFELIPVQSTSAGAFIGLFEKQGWLNRAFAMTGDEPHDADAYNDVISKAKAAKQATGGKLRTWITKLYDTPPGFPSLHDDIDIFCAAATSPEEIPELDAKHKTIWTYNAGYAGSCATDAPGVASRTNAWAGYVSGARAWYFWDAMYVVDRQMKMSQRYKGNKRPWSTDPKPYLTDVWADTLTLDESLKPLKNGKLYGERDALRINGDGNLIYAGNGAGIDEPVVDFRVKNIRLGAQDFEYLYLLEKMGHKDIALKEAQRLLGDVKRLGGPSGDGQAGEMKYAYDTDGEKWDAARIRLGEALDKIGDTAIRAKVTPWNQFPNPTGSPDYLGGKRF